MALLKQDCTLLKAQTLTIGRKIINLNLNLNLSRNYYARQRRQEENDLLL